MVEDRGRALARAEAEALDALGAHAGRFPAKPICLVRHGEAAEQIVAYAREIDAGMIVMATHSRMGLARMLLGSTTAKVVGSGAAPVLIVHPGG